MEIAWPSRIRSRAYGFDIERRVWWKLALVSSLRGDPTLKGRVKSRDPVASCSSRCFFHFRRSRRSAPALESRQNRGPARLALGLSFGPKVATFTNAALVF